MITPKNMVIKYLIKRQWRNQRKTRNQIQFQNRERGRSVKQNRKYARNRKWWKEQTIENPLLQWWEKCQGNQVLRKNITRWSNGLHETSTKIIETATYSTEIYLSIKMGITRAAELLTPGCLKQQITYQISLATSLAENSFCVYNGLFKSLGIFGMHWCGESQS